MEKMTDEEKSQEAGKRFLTQWGKTAENLKPSLLHLLMEGKSEFNDWSSDEQFDFLISVLKDNAPSKLNIFDKKFTKKREIFKKAFLAIFKGRKKVCNISLWEAYVSHNFKDSSDRVSEKLTKIEIVLKTLEEIQHPYYTEDIPKIMHEFFFLNSPVRRALSTLLQHALEFISATINSTDLSEIVKKIHVLTIKIAVQTFNTDLLKENNLYNSSDIKLILKILKEEYYRCITTILEKGYHLELNSTDKKEFRETFEIGKFSEKIDYLIHSVLKDESWLLFMLEVMALDGKFDEIKM